MSSDLERISSFIANHHVMSLATTYKDELSVCSLFYVYDALSKTFVVASSEETKHIEHIKNNANIAGNILLETKKIGEIKGLQFRGNFSQLDDAKLKLHYYKAFPYALAMNPTLWKIEVEFLKYTDNVLGFGKKLVWERTTSSKVFL